MSASRSIARVLLPACALGASALLAACGDANGPGNAAGENLSLAVATVPSAPAGQLTGAFGVSLDRHVSNAAGTHTIVITSVAVVLSRLELATADSAGCAADDHPEPNDDRCHELKTGPMLVQLPTDNSVVSVLSVALPNGTYRALEAKVRAVRSQDDGGSTFLAAHPELAGKSVRVEGTFDGTPFVYTGDPSASLELTFDPPLTVVSAATTLTLHVSIDRWFADRDGNLIDPSTANAGGANEQLVDDNVHRSFHAFEDRDRHGDDGHNDDGFDDHGNDGNGHDGGDDHGGDGRIVH